MFSDRKIRHVNDNEYSGLQFRDRTLSGILKERISDFRDWWKSQIVPREVPKLEDYEGIFDKPITAQIITLSPARKNRKR